MIRKSITINNVDKCSGGCLYCIAASNMNYSMGVNYNDIITSVKHIDDMMYKQAQFDFDALEKLLDNDPDIKKVIKDNQPISFDTWGADPVTCFQCLQEVVEFIEHYCYTRHINNYSISTSTNGLPLLRDDVCNYLREHHIHVQLSHDGLGQWIRTKDVDPLDFDNIRKLLREGVITAINATLCFWNYSLFNNIKYFNSKLKEIFPEVWSDKEMASERLSNVYKRLYIKLNHIMDGEYDVKGKHKDYGIPLGDMSLHNDVALQNEIGYGAHVLDDYLYEWDVYFEKVRSNKHNTLELMPFNRYLIEQLKRGRKMNDWHKDGNMCRKYQMGSISYSEHIDTTGRYCDCNLQDADHPVPNRENKKPEHCDNCKYKDSAECNMCGSVIPRKECEYYYRWNQFLDKTRGTLVHGNNNKSRRNNKHN